MFISIVLTIIGLVLIILELIIGIDTGFDLLLLGISLLIGGLIGYFSIDMIGVVVSTILAFAYLLIGRKFLKNKIQAFSHHSNTDSLLGSIAIIKMWNKEKNFGIINVEGEDWRVKSIDNNPIEINSKVKILNVSGVTLIVTTNLES